MKDVIIRTDLAANVNKVRNYMNRVRESVTWLHENLPREDVLKEQSRVVFDQYGEVFLYYDGVHYPWKMILSILKENDVVTIESLYDELINE